MKISHLRTTILLTVTSLTNAIPVPVINKQQIQAATTGHVTAIGIGITSLDVTNKFYVSVFGFGKGTRASFSGWDEDIMIPLRGGGPTLIPMKFKTGGASPINEDRPVKDLPVKLTFTVPDAKGMVDKIVKAGGKAATVNGGKQGASYAKDPDGYLLELVSGSAMAFSGAGYGSSSPQKSAAFYAKLAGTSPSPVAKEGAWDATTVPSSDVVGVSGADIKTRAYPS